MQEPRLFTFLQRETEYIDNKALTFTGKEERYVLAIWGETDKERWKQATALMHDTMYAFGSRNTVTQLFPTEREDDKHENEELQPKNKVIS